MTAPAPSQPLALIRQEDLARAEQLAALAISSAEQEKDAVDGLSFVQGLLRAVKAEHKSQRGPVKETLDKLDASFKAVLAPLEAAETGIKGAMLTWRRAEAERIRQEQERVARENSERERKAKEEAEAEKQRAAQLAEQEAKQAGFTEPEVKEYVASEVKEIAPQPTIREVPPAAPAQTVRSVLGSATVRKVWTYEFTDQAAVPHAYRDCAPSAGKIRLAISAGVRDIPGVRIFQDEQIAGKRTG